MIDTGASGTHNRQSRTTVVTFLGAVVRPLGDWMPIAGAVDLLVQAGLDAPSVRTAVHRLKGNGWLESEARDGARGYALTDAALETLAAGDEVIWHARTPADARRRLVHRPLRRARVDAAPSASSCAPTSPTSASATSAPPSGSPPPGCATPPQRAVAELGLEAHTAVFVGDYHGTQDLTGLLYDSWDLAGIDQSYRDFVADARHARRRPSSASGPSRRRRSRPTSRSSTSGAGCRSATPACRREVLAPDWSGPRAVAVFERLVAGSRSPPSRTRARTGRRPEDHLGGRASVDAWATSSCDSAVDAAMLPIVASLGAGRRGLGALAAGPRRRARGLGAGQGRGVAASPWSPTPGCCRRCRSS